MKGRIFVRHMDNIRVTHSRRYLRLDGMSIEFTDEWEDAAKEIHRKYGDEMWKTTLERIIRAGLKNFKEIE